MTKPVDPVAARFNAHSASVGDRIVMSEARR